LLALILQKKWTEKGRSLNSRKQSAELILSVVKKHNKKTGSLYLCVREVFMAQ
jgi:hypothetical protein